MNKIYSTKTKRFILSAILFFTTGVVSVYAQDTDFGIWSTVAVEKKINSKWEVDLEAELRTKNHTRDIGRWSISPTLSYKVTPWLKATLGYALINDRHSEKNQYDSSNTLIATRTGYWGLRHRGFVDLTLTKQWGNWEFQLRERGEYTHKPQRTISEYRHLVGRVEEANVPADNKQLLRSRIQATYKNDQLPIEPYANIELFHGWALERLRYTAGLSWKLNDQHSISGYYRFQDKNSHDGDQDMHIIGLGYSYKL